MSTNVVEVRQPERRLSVVEAMADRFGMAAGPFEATVRATCMPVGRDDPEPTREEFAAFLLVAREHNLNPVTREIYAMRRKGGGLIPVVSVDGWVRKINEHPAFDGMEFQETVDDRGALISTTCTIWRKDRSRPTVVTEYLAECVRPTDPWRMKHRMLRHKAAIQCARYAFGFAGIFDDDEAERIAGVERPAPPTPPNPPRPALAGPRAAVEEVAHEVLPPSATPPVPPKPPVPPRPQAGAPAAPVTPKPPVAPAAVMPPAAVMADIANTDLPLEKRCAIIDEIFSKITDGEELNRVWLDEIAPLVMDWFPGDVQEADGLYRKHERRVAP